LYVSNTLRDTIRSVLARALAAREKSGRAAQRTAGFGAA
jgi:hypothetical protein